MSNALTTKTSTFDLSPQTFDQALTFSQYLADSDMVPKDYKGKPENCLVAMQWGADVGLPGLQALQNIAVINGRPSIWGDAAKALVLNHPSCDDIEEWIEGEGDNMTAVCIAKRKGKRPVEQRFSVADAKKAQLWGKAGPWQAYAKRMLQMRARGFALRDAFPDALRGLVLAEEAQDYTTEKDMGTVEVVDKPTISMPAPKVKAEPKPEVKPKQATTINNDTGEIFPPIQEQPQEAQPVNPPRPQQQTAPGQASVGMLTFIRKKAAEKDIPEEVVCVENDIETLDGIDEAKGNAIIGWIKAQ